MLNFIPIRTTCTPFRFYLKVNKKQNKLYKFHFINVCITNTNAYDLNSHILWQALSEIDE